MKLQFGKTKSPTGPGDESVDRTVEEQTLERWRQAASSTGASGETPQWGEEVTHDVPLRSSSLREEELSSDVKLKPSAPSPSSSSAVESVVSKPVKRVERKADTSGAAVKEAIGPGTVIQGQLRFEAPVRIDGSLAGEVTSTSALIVGEQGTVEASVNVGTLIVYGQVLGDVVAKDLVDLRAGGHVEGNIKTSRLSIEEGAYFSGQCQMAKPQS